MKSPIFHRIKREDPSKYQQLNKWVYKELQPLIEPLGKEFCQRFRRYFSSTTETLNKQVLSAAHFYATKWEFDIIEKANPNGYEIEDIKKSLREEQEKYYDRKGIDALAKYANYRSFVNLCGELRFQMRWSHIHRVPKTSVMGHLLFVAIFSYLMSREIRACPQRCVNNYFTGLFHDLPEVLTKDIISPVKRSVPGLDKLIKRYETELMEKEIFNLIPPEWRAQMEMFTVNEFENIATVRGRRKKVASTQELCDRYNNNKYNARDGELVKAADEMAAFIEAYAAIRNGSATNELREAIAKYRRGGETRKIGSLNLGEIYADFD